MDIRSGAHVNVISPTTMYAANRGLLGQSPLPSLLAPTRHKVLTLHMPQT
jgi:hypothetical protein